MKGAFVSDAPFMRLVLAAMAFLALGHQARAETGSVEVAGRRVLLPPGEWQVLARQLEQQVLSDGTPYVPGRAPLVQEMAGRAVGAVEVAEATSLPGGGARWPVGATCRETGGYRREVQAATALRQDCWALEHVSSVDAVSLARRPPTEVPARMWRG